jgi:peptidoglycan hydrolase-like protein with peptidoglycan-binding domain
MSQRHIRYGFVCFFVLSIGFVANILWLQPNSWQGGGRSPATASISATKQVKAPRSSAAKSAEKQMVGDGTAQSPMVLNASAKDLSSNTLDSMTDAANAASAASRDLVRAVQRELTARGYRPGAEDGISGSVTRAAIMAYQFDHGLPVTSEVSEGLLQHIVLGTSPAMASEQQPAAARSVAAMRDVVAKVQSRLNDLGYYRGAIDGQRTAALGAAIRKFERQQQWRPTGRISGRLVTQLEASNGTGALANRW